MPKFCPNCGIEISDKVKFCPKCGADIDSFSVKKNEKLTIEEIKKDVKIDNTKPDNKNIKPTYNVKKLSAFVLIIAGIVIIFFIGMAFIAGMVGESQSSSQYSTQPQTKIVPNYFVPTPTESQTDRNIRIANEIVANYHKSHTYSLIDFYVCGDMASDVWDMLKTQGINAKINVGNVEKDVTSFSDANHAWVLAEVGPNQYLALEATGGYSVKKTDNPRYYSGWSFYNPKQLKNYEDLLTQYNVAHNKYNSALKDYNAIVSQYNNAGLLSRISLKGQVDDKALILQQRTQDLNQISQQISALLSSL